MIRCNSLQPADRDRLSVHTLPAAGRLTRTVTRSSQNAGKYIRIAVQEIGVGVPALRYEAYVFGNVGVSGTSPLAIDYLMKVVRIANVGGYHDRHSTPVRATMAKRV